MHTGGGVNVISQLKGPFHEPTNHADKRQQPQTKLPVGRTAPIFCSAAEFFFSRQTMEQTL